MVRSLALAFVVLSSSQAAAGDLPSVYVAPGGIYAPSAHIYLGPGPAYQEPPYVGRSRLYGRPYVTPAPTYGSPAYGSPAYGLPASDYEEAGPVYAPPAYREREPAYLSRDYEIAPRPPLAVPYAGRGRCVVNLGYGRWANCD